MPVLEAESPDSSIFEWTRGIDGDSPQVGLFRHALPFSEFSAKARDAYVTSLDLTSDGGQWGLVLKMEALRAADAGTGYYYAAAASVNGYVRGRARLAAWASIGKALGHRAGPRGRSQPGYAPRAVRGSPGHRTGLPVRRREHRRVGIRLPRRISAVAGRGGSGASCATGKLPCRRLSDMPTPWRCERRAGWATR